MPASSAIRASLRLSGQLPDQRSGTMVTARPDEQFGPNRPICSRLELYIAARSGEVESTIERGPGTLNFTGRLAWDLPRLYHSQPILHLSMIWSENRFPLFGIML